jgi:large repetitive protein
MRLERLLLLLALLLPITLVGCPDDDDDVVDDDDATADDDDAVDDDDATDPPGEYTFEAEEGGPVGTICGDPDPTPAGGATCAVDAGSPSQLVRGIVLGAGEVYLGGELLLDAAGQVACVGCDCSASTGYDEATVLSCPWAVVSPGLINAHDHIYYTQNHPASHEGIRYQHRHDWRVGNNGHDPLPYDGGASDMERAWGELRFIVGGATSILGSGNSDGLLRNLDADQEGLWEGSVGYETFPLGDSGGQVRTSGCDYPDIDGPSVLNDDAYTPHISEGIDTAARNELLCLSSDENGGSDVTEHNTGIIHAVGIDATDAAMLAHEGAKVIWSARTNIDLYGNTAPATLLDSVGVRIGLGTDWTPSGSMNMLRELSCIDSLNTDYYGGWFDDWQLWEMATYGGAMATEVHDATGSLAAGMAGDVAIFAAGAHSARPFRAIIEADPGDVALVLRGGDVLYGDSATVEALPGGGASCDELPGDVCGAAKRACIQREIGTSYASLASSNSSSYDLYSCNEPDDEPSCVPMRPGEYDGTSTTDTDGDGLDNDVDLCPAVFDPVRPMDNGVQRDHDEDGLGDACDPCPLGENDAGDCFGFDPDDRDSDGITDDLDNCPMTPNFLQEDGDGDLVGDACDPCPLDFNEPGRNCPATIYEIKQGLLAEGFGAALDSVIVTANNDSGFYVQVLTADLDGILGSAFSGLWVYAPTSDDFTPPAPGDVITFDTTITLWWGQWEGTAPEIISTDATGVPLPEPVEVDNADVATGGDLADDYEGVLVVTSGIVTSYDPPAGPGDADPTGEFMLDETLRVNDQLTSLEPRPLIDDEVQVTGVLRWANDDSKLEPRSLDDIEVLLLGPPELDDFGPDTVFIYDGDVAASSLPALMLTIDRPAPVGGTEITLTSGDPLVLAAPATVTIPEAGTEVEIQLDGLAISAGAVQLDATLDGDTLSVQVEVLDPARLPVLTTLDPAASLLSVGQVETFTVGLDIPAPTDGTTVMLSLSPGTAGAVDSEVYIAEGLLSATFDVEGLGAGLETLTATLDAVSLTADLDIQALPDLGLIITEVFYDPGSDDDGKEWIELYNGSYAEIDLSGYSLGAGGTDYTYTQVQLSGTLGVGECFVVGGPDSVASNGSPVYDLVSNINPDLQNSGSTADGVALFDMVESAVGASTVPIDAVVYGTTNGSGLLGPSGSAAVVDVGDAPSDQSIERLPDGLWQIQAAPSPNDCSHAL